MRQIAKQVTSLLCPLLLAAFPLLSLFAQNQSEVELSLLWQPVGLCAAAAAGVFGIFLLITKRAAKAGVLASLAVFAFFYYGLFFDRGSGSSLALWLGVLLVGLVAVLRTTRDLANLMVVLGVGAVVMLLPQAIKIATYHANHPSLSASDPRLWPTALQKPVVSSAAALPDVYVIIPDDYARIDVLKKYFHYDDAEFVRQLEKRGFAISQQGRSPYSDSESNIAATLNMDYLSSFPGVLGTSSQDVRPVKRVIEDNRAARLLRPLGYHYIHLDTDEVTFAGGNPHISPFAPPDSFANLWLQKSVLRPVGGSLGFNQAAGNERFRTSIRSVFSQLADVPSTSGPKFVVFHTLLPHDPYIYDARGRPVTFPGKSDEDLASTTGRAYYLQQLEFLNQKLLAAVDQILAHSKTPPVVVLQADEGFQANPEPFGEAAMEDIRVKGLTALYLPGLNHLAAPQSLNTVNTLRFVFNHYLGTNYEMLKSASYAEGDLPYQPKEIRVK